MLRQGPEPPAGGMLVTVAGTGRAGYLGDGGPATAAQLSAPVAVAVGADGTLYVADSGNSVIRKVTPDGTITTVAGTGAAGFSGDGGRATAAQLAYPLGLAVAGDRTLYIADTDNHRIRRVDPDGIISTVAGSGTYGYAEPGQPAVAAPLAYPGSVAIAGDGSLYVADTEHHCVWLVGTDGRLAQFAGTGLPGYSGDGGPASLAHLRSPSAVTVAGGTVYVADSGNSAVRAVAPDGTISTVAGTGTYGYGRDGGPARRALLTNPYGLAIAADGTLYVADTHSRRIRNVKRGGMITTAAGGGPAAAWPITPYGLAPAADGAVYVADAGSNRILKIIAW